MAKSHDSEILDYLEKPENIALTFEIANFAQKLRERIISGFWESLKRAIENASPERFGEFAVIQSGDITASYCFLRAAKNSVSTQRTFLSFTVERERLTGPERFNLYVALRWSPDVSKDDMIYKNGPALRLKDRLTAQGWEFWPPMWICGNRVKEFATPDEFYCYVVKNADDLLKQLTVAFWQLVEDTEAEVAEINKLVASR